jgi:hypothetical protein
LLDNLANEGFRLDLIYFASGLANVNEEISEFVVLEISFFVEIKYLVEESNLVLISDLGENDKTREHLHGINDASSIRVPYLERFDV